MNVARQRSLRHFKSATTELAPQFVLVCHQCVRYKFSNRVVSLKLHIYFRTKQKRGSQWRPRLHKYTKKVYKYASWFFHRPDTESPK
jgi:hypothetical protein